MRALRRRPAGAGTIGPKVVTKVFPDCHAFVYQVVSERQDLEEGQGYQ